MKMSQNFFSDIPSGRIAYTKRGDGPKLVLLHPIGIDRTWWDPYVLVWQKNYQVLTIDLRGHGDSSRVREPITLSAHATDVAGVLDQEGIEAATIIGVSMGGMVAQRLAIEAPNKVKAMILCATAGSFPDHIRESIRSRGNVSRDGEMSEVVEESLARWFLPDSPRPDLLERCRADLLKGDWFSWSANWEAIAAMDNLEKLQTTQAPALVITGGADIAAPPAISRQLANAIPKAKLVIVPAASHFGAFETPSAFLPAFDTFLEQAGR